MARRFAGLVVIALIVILAVGGGAGSHRRPELREPARRVGAGPFLPRARPLPAVTSATAAEAPPDAAPLVGVATVQGRVVTTDGLPATGAVAWRPADERR